MKITETDAITGVTIEREPTAEEIAEFEASEAAAIAKQEAAAVKAAEREAVLAKLKLTSDEAAALLS